MDTNFKSLQLMGAFGIVGEAFKIIRSRAKLLGSITLVLILPYVLIILAYSLLAPLLLAKIISKEITVEGRLHILQLAEISVVEIVCIVSFYAALMPSIAAVAYTVASVYNGKQEPSFSGVMRLVPAAWKHMMITCLWYFIVNFVISVTFVFVVCLLSLGFLVFHKSYAIPFYVEVVVVSVVLVCVSMYVVIVWQMATVVSVMEKEYYGLEAMKKSRRLLQGKRATAWVLTIFYMVIFGPFAYAVGKGNMYAGGLGAKIAYVVLGCVSTLMWKLMQSVLYFVCKSQHGETVDEWCVSEGYLGEYQPINKRDVQILEP